MHSHTRFQFFVNRDLASTQRKLGVDGEQLSKVVYRLIEPEQYRDHHVLVVGGGDSAIEAGLAIAEIPGARVTLSYRGD